MGMFTRINDIINANINGLLDKAENPEKMLRLIIQEMEETLVEVRSSAAKNLADKKGLLRQIRNHETKVSQWQDKAELAINKQREDLARQALIEKQKCQQKVDDIKQELDIIDDNLTLVQDDSQRLQEKLNEAKQKQHALVRREESAVVRLKVREKLHSDNIDNAINKYERYQQKIDDLEAQVEAYDFTESKDLAKQIDELASNDAVEAELTELKKKVANA